MGAAWELNPLVPLLPLAAAGVALWRWRRWPVPAFLRKSWAIWLGAGALIFTVFRNWKG